MSPSVQRHRGLLLLTLLIPAAGCGDLLPVGHSSPPAGSAPTGGSPDPAASEPLAERDFAQPWVLIKRIASGKTIDAVARGPAGFVALTHDPAMEGPKLVVRKNIAALSTDGVNWTEQPIVPDGFYHAITGGAGLYVAVGGALADSGGAGVVVVSRDGRSWMEVARASGVLRRVRHTAGGFLAVGQSHGAMISPDGLTWREFLLANSPPAAQFNDVNFGGGRFVAVGMTLHISDDGQRWAPLACGPQLPCLAVTDPSGGTHAILNLYTSLFGNGAFLASGTAGLLRSTDGLTWSRLGDARGGDLIFAAGQYLELEPANRQDPFNTTYSVSTSTDGAGWQVRTTALPVRSDLTCADHRCLVFPAAIAVVP
jgi:hypothetical protein